ncbi:MAG: PilZ domain-containing protein [Gammaproteobacteria bacterium]|nr:PilZ domain-containing protein [Gammaproteobacteria bacterium]
MATDYSEKRNFFRMNMECNMNYSVNGSGEQKCGNIKNLSGDGVSFLIDQAVEEGTEIHIAITPENTVTPPLNITVEVLRCDQTSNDVYEVAGNITRR